ncbi:MAG: TetR/AcrR family transcriptional regulator [Nanoarchaeota archaeon]
MPKIIENVEEKTFKNVIDLINENGFKNTSMKMIADKTGIAVGTLYNYFSNKENLIFYVIKRSWNQSFKKLDSILIEDLSAEKKFEKFIITLYKEISARKVIGRELIQNNIIEKEKFVEIRDILITKFKALFKILENENFTLELDQKRLIDTIFVTISSLNNLYDNEEKNINYLKMLSKKIIK